MATVTIGGKDYTIPELNFIALERAWPFIEQSMISLDPMEGASTGIRIIACGLQEAEDFKPAAYGIITELLELTEDQIHEHLVVFLKKQLKASELKNIGPCVDKIIEEAGLESDEGELKAAGLAEGSPSGETAPDTSSSSSPQELKAEAGVT